MRAIKWCNQNVKQGRLLGLRIPNNPLTPFQTLIRRSSPMSLYLYLIMNSSTHI